MAVLNPRLADLSDLDRLVLESWLVEFDQRWDDGILANRAQQIPPGSSWRLPALAEMVKIDLERQWQRGRQVSLESYLKDFPELGNPGDVSADLIQAEYEVRRQFGAPAALEDYLRRFPHQAGELARLIAQGSSSLSRRSSSSGVPKPAENTQELPEQFGRYRILKRLGQGGMGSVHLAEDTQLQRRVALKVANYGTEGGPEARKRLLAEARAAATLDHPYLCPVHDVGEIDGRLYLTMAYIEGQSLAESTRGKSLPPRSVAALVGKLAVALQEAHAKGVIHRDLKPSNVMIKSTGSRREPVIVDFGLARREDANEGRLTKTGQVMGTLDYMAPEQLRGELKEIGPACDIYALGVILYELLTGRLPFEGSGLAVVGQILTQAPLPPSTFRPDLDPRLEAICLKAMAKTVGDRFTSMADLAAALTDYLRAPAPASTPSPSAPVPTPGGQSSPPAGSDTLVARLLDRVVTNPGQASLPPEALPPALANHPDYQVKRELGRGGMGVVYLAHNTLMGRDEVLKVMGRQIMDSPDLLERFLREIRAVAKLRHPNIVTAYSATRLGESIVFAMEYVEGLDLAKMVQAKGPLPVGHACNFVAQAALGLQHAHEEGLVHRDIKPGNLMLSRKGDKATVKVLDFGLAKATREGKVDGALTSAGQALGTPDYIAPEQILDAPTADIRADIYSLGATLYHLLTGRPPFQANSLYDIYQAHISREVDPLNRVRPDVPAELAALVAKMMAKEPPQRFQTPGEVARALTPFIKNADAASKSLKVDVSPAGPTNAGRLVTGAGYAATQVETEADRAKGRIRKAAAPSGAESRWESMIDFKEDGISREAEPEAAPRRRPAWVWPSVAVGVLLFGLVGAWLGGVFKVKTPDGVIVLENVPKDSEIFVDGNKITFSWPGLGKPLEIRAVPGQHKVEVKKDGFRTYGEVVTFKKDESEEVTVRLEPLVVERRGTIEKDASEAKAGEGPQPKKEAVQPRLLNDNAGATGFVSLFNGKDLTGWKTHPSQPGHWRVENGVLIGSGPGISNLYTNRGDYTDFHIRVDARINGGGNSGVCFRTPYGPTWPVDNPKWVPGYEAQINSTNSDPNKTGSLFGASGAPLVSVGQSEHFPGWWFTLEVIADGNRLVIMVNGKITAHFIDDERRYSQGHITLQLQDPVTVVEFRKIEIKELNGAHQLAAPDLLVPKVITNSIGMTLALIPTGEFLMGSPEEDKEAGIQEKPRHSVRITRPFYLGTTEVTQGQFRTVTGQSPSHFKGSNALPVEMVSWNEAMAFCDRLSELEKGQFGGTSYRLPTEAEWEYACRGGSMSRYSFGDDAARLGEFAWYDGTSGGRTHPVGEKRPNAFNLYDMHGNVWEWCQDWYVIDYYGQSPGVDPLGPPQTGFRLYRGGSWDDFPQLARSAYRSRLTPAARSFSVGFRVARAEKLPGTTDATDRPAQAPVVRPEAEWVRLFNGRDLTGWNAVGDPTTTWRVENGVLVGRSPGGGSLQTIRADYRNFHIRVQTMLSEGKNSALFFRSNDHGGYVADIGGTDPDSASMAADLRAALPGRKPNSKLLVDAPEIKLRAGEWFSQEVIAVDNKFTILVNGTKVVDYHDNEKHSTIGGFGILCRWGTVVRFRSIEVKELPHK